MNKPFAINYTDKQKSAKLTTFFDKFELRKYLCSQVIAGSISNMSLLELLQAYNVQHGDLIEISEQE